MLRYETCVAFWQAIGNIIFFHQAQEERIEIGRVALRFVFEWMIVPDLIQAIIGQNAFQLLGGAVFEHEADGFGQPFGFEDDVVAQFFVVE